MPNPEMVQCFACKSEMMSKLFDKHNLEKHNMLSWKMGESPLDLKNEKLILSILNKVLKSKKKKILSCDSCSEEKKSALGFFTHKQICGKSAEEVQSMRITCEICGRSMMPVSFRPHMQAHERTAALEQNSTAQEDSPFETKAKRAAATKAQSRMSGALMDKDVVPSRPAKRSRKVLSYTKLDVALSNPNPKLFLAWKNVIDAQGVVFCPFKECSFEAYNATEMQNHVSGCNGFSSHDMAFLCNWCLYQCKDESQIVMHIHSEHFSDGSDASCVESGSSSDDDFSSEDEKERKRTVNRQKNPAPQRTLSKMKFLVSSSYGHSKDLDIYPAALKWTFDFRKENYSDSIFSHLNTFRRDWKNIPETEAEKYFPTTRMSVSTEFNSPGHKNNCRRYSLFESDVTNGECSMFTGGPVWAMEWCPIPMKECLSKIPHPVEYLAVSSHHNMDDFHFAQTCYSSPNIIQLWDCGSLEDDQLQPPKLALALAHDFGTIWSLAWCPSGAYDVDCESKYNENSPLRRLGLLSAACSDGAVRVFSIPFPQQLETSCKEGVPPVFKCSSSLTLISNFSEPSQCTRVTWYQGKNHRLLVGGFTNGMIALWDLDNLAPLLWNSELKTLRPYHSFQAHLSVVTALSFCPEYEGRFLMTGSHDRTVKFWDLEDTSTPLSLHRRGLVTDGIWLGLWISSITSYDDAFLLEHTNSTLHPVRDFGYKAYPLLVQNSVAWSLSFNEWINAVAQGSEAGEIVLSFSNQLLQGLETEKHTVAKRVMASYTLLKKLAIGDDGKEKLTDVVTLKLSSSDGKGGKSSKNSKSRKQTQDEDVSANAVSSRSSTAEEIKPRTYKDTVKMYGISIHDTIKGRANKNKMPAEALSQVRLSGRMHPVSSDLYPITSINKVSWNPNINRFFWLACGHHCGIIRIIGVHFMDSPQVGRFLSTVSEEICPSDL